MLVQQRIFATWQLLYWKYEVVFYLQFIFTALSSIFLKEISSVLSSKIC